MTNLKFEFSKFRNLATLGNLTLIRFITKSWCLDLMSKIRSLKPSKCFSL
jgi:hypothetical protein